MKNLEQYKSRFYNLMESTIGEVKPLITEQETESWKKFMQDLQSALGKKDQEFIYDTTGRYNKGLPTIQKGTWYDHFRIQYSPTNKRVIWFSTNKSVAPEVKKLDFFVKDANNQETPQNPKEIQKAITDITTKYDFSSFPKTNLDPPKQQPTQPAQQPKQPAR